MVKRNGVEEQRRPCRLLKPGSLSSSLLLLRLHPSLSAVRAGFSVRFLLFYSVFFACWLLHFNGAFEVSRNFLIFLFLGFLVSLVLMELANETTKYMFPNRRFESRSIEEALMSGSLEIPLLFSWGFFLCWLSNLLVGWLFMHFPFGFSVNIRSSGYWDGGIRGSEMAQTVPDKRSRGIIVSMLLG